jgi:hypothetical protein
MTTALFDTSCEREQCSEIDAGMARRKVYEMRRPHAPHLWRKDGPVHEFFVTRVAPEFLRARFDAPAEELRFIGGVLSAASQAQIKAAIEHLAREFEELAHRDARLPLEAKNGCSALLAFRQWEFSEFTHLRRR